jgi:hypothetical protein
MILGMAWCSVQDFKTCTVTLLPLMMCVCSGLLYSYRYQVGSGLLIAIVYLLLLRQYMCGADCAAICASVVWFDTWEALVFFAITGSACLLIHWIRGTREVPMMPAIATGWIVTHWLNWITIGLLNVVIFGMQYISYVACKISHACAGLK